MVVGVNNVKLNTDYISLFALKNAVMSVSFFLLVIHKTCFILYVDSRKYRNDNKIYWLLSVLNKYDDKNNYTSK